MRKIYLLFLIINIPAALWAEPVYYRSNSVGLELEIINKYRLDEFEYVLEVNKSKKVIEKKLFQNMKEYRRMETYFNDDGIKTELKEFEDGKIVFRTEFDRKGNRKYEEIYSIGELQEKKYYFYSPRGVDHVDTFNSRDIKLYTDEYDISLGGRLRSIRRIFPDDSFRIRHYTYSGTQLVEEWEYSEGIIYILVYNEKGKLLRRETWEKDELVKLTEIEYDDANERIIREVEKDLENDITLTREYDNEGKVTKETIDDGGGFPEDTQYTYRNDRVAGIRKKSEIGVEEWKYFFDDTGRLVEEKYYRRGFLEMRTVYTDDETWYEEIFRNEEIFVRVYYKNSNKVREEFIQDGTVIRTREFE